MNLSQGSIGVKQPCYKHLAGLNTLSRLEAISRVDKFEESQWARTLQSYCEKSEVSN